MVGFFRESQKEELLENVRKLKESPLAEVGVSRDLTRRQREEEAELEEEALRKNETISEEDRAKNLEWRVVGQKGERRLIKATKPMRDWRGRGGGRGGPRGRAGRVETARLPSRRNTAGDWDPAVGGRGAGSNSGQQKRTREERSTDKEQELDEPPARR